MDPGSIAAIVLGVLLGVLLLVGIIILVIWFIRKQKRKRQSHAGEEFVVNDTPDILSPPDEPPMNEPDEVLKYSFRGVPLPPPPKKDKDNWLFTTG